MIALVGGLALAASGGGDGPGRRAALQPEEPAGPTTDAREPAPRPTPSTTARSGRPGAPAGWRTHTDPDTGYRLSYPSGWRVEDRDRTRTDFLDPENGAYLRVDFPPAGD